MLKVRAGRALPEIRGHEPGGEDMLAARTRKATWSLGRAPSCPSTPARWAVVALASCSRSGSEWGLVREMRRNMDMKCLFV